MVVRILALLIAFFIIVPSKGFSKEGIKIQLPWTFEAKVDYVLDGDSVRVWEIKDKLLFLVSLYGIDCPEIAQPFGFEAKYFVEKILGKKKFTVTLVKMGKYNTALGYIQVDDEDLGSKLVRNGLAEVDRGSVRVFAEPEVKKRYMTMQKKAQKNKTGMWIQGKDYVYPLDFLRKKQSKKKNH